MTFEHPFFRRSDKEQRRFQFKLGLASLIVLLVSGGLLFAVVQLPLLLLVLAVEFAVVLSIIAPFFDVPALVRSGKLRYYSPFLLAERERNGTVVLHAGTLFDSWFLFPREMPAGDRKRLALTGIVNGLIQLIDEHETRENRADRSPSTIRITSYILNERNARRLGLERRPTDAMQKFILYYNYFNLTASFSLLHRHLRFPSIRSVQTFEGRLAELAEQKARLEALRDRLER